MTNIYSTGLIINFFEFCLILFIIRRFLLDSIVLELLFPYYSDIRSNSGTVNIRWDLSVLKKKSIL